MKEYEELKNKVVIITGASQGLGFEIAKSFAKLGSNLAICARNRFLLKKSLDKLKTYTESGQKIFAFKADVTNQREVFVFVKKIIKKFNKIDILINNAGILGPKGKMEELNWKQWIRTTEINLFGSVLMCRAVLPHFKKAKKGKIIQISGGGATNPKPMFTGYCASKAAIVRFVETLALEVKNYNIQVNSVAPGPLNTNMLNEVLQAGPKKVGKDFYIKAIQQKKNGGTSFKIPKELIFFLSSSRSRGITGKLISARRDNWKNWPRHLKKIASSDVYTLRRIIGKDRSFSLGDKKN